MKTELVGDVEAYRTEELSHLAQFSLFEGDLVNRIFARSGLRARPLGDLLARIVILLCLTWIPLALLAVLSGVGMGRPPRENFFLDVAAYGQFILGLPLFVIAESVIAGHTREAAKSFLASGGYKLSIEHAPLGRVRCLGSFGGVYRRGSDIVYGPAVYVYQATLPHQTEGS